MRALGVPQEQLRQALARQQAHQGEDDEVVPVAPHLAEVVELFASLRGQWRVVSRGRLGLQWLGLDYTGVRSTMWMLRLRPKRRDRLHRYLGVMELEALRVLNRG